MTSNCTSCIIPYVKNKKKKVLSCTQIMFNSQVHKGKHYRIDSPKYISKIFLNALLYLQTKGKEIHEAK